MKIYIFLFTLLFSFAYLKSMEPGISDSEKQLYAIGFPIPSNVFINEDDSDDFWDKNSAIQLRYKAVPSLAQKLQRILKYRIRSFQPTSLGLFAVLATMGKFSKDDDTFRKDLYSFTRGIARDFKNQHERLIKTTIDDKICGITITSASLECLSNNTVILKFEDHSELNALKDFIKEKCHLIKLNPDIKHHPYLPIGTINPEDAPKLQDCIQQIEDSRESYDISSIVNMHTISNHHNSFLPSTMHLFKNE